MKGEEDLRRRYEASVADLGLAIPDGLPALLATKLGSDLNGLIYWPGADERNANSLAAAGRLLDQAFWPPPENLLPLLPVDDRSIACAVCTFEEEPEEGDDNGSAEPLLSTVVPVVRWHLDAIDEEFQGTFLDADAITYLKSVHQELGGRSVGLAHVAERSRRYYADYVMTGEQPRKFVPRPIQLACQNVIIGFAILQQDATFDGLRVHEYLTCEAPHLATHEGDRAMAALILCDAFQCGGTMELRFGAPGHDAKVPPALMRYGRVIGIALGEEDAGAITPNEARALFLAVTPFPDDLRLRVMDLFDRGLVSPERICFTLMSSIWSAIELDYILSTSPRGAAILDGGASFRDRRARLAEAEACRSAVMTGMLHRRLNGRDGAGSMMEQVRVFEDNAAPKSWTVLDRFGMVAFAGVSSPVPWRSHRHRAVELGDDGMLIAAPRAMPTPSDYEQIRACAAEFPDCAVVLVTSAGMADFVPPDIAVLVCPDRLAELDIDIERRLMRSRTGSA